MPPQTRPSSQSPIPFDRRESPQQAARPPLLPLLAADIDITPTIERLLRQAALRALDGEHAARDALFAAFEPKLRRMARRVPIQLVGYGFIPVWDYEDVWQVSYVVFAGLTENWRPEVPFGRYVLGNFPWRLRDAVYRGFANRKLAPDTRLVALVDADAHRDPDAARLEEELLTAAIEDVLEPREAALFRARIMEGLSSRAAARKLGMSETTARRVWHGIIVNLRAAERAAGR